MGMARESNRRLFAGRAASDREGGGGEESEGKRGGTADVREGEQLTFDLRWASEQLSGITLVVLLLRDQGIMEELVQMGGAQAWHTAAPASAAPDALPNM